jgi:hypothetical protein
VSAQNDNRGIQSKSESLGNNLNMYYTFYPPPSLPTPCWSIGSHPNVGGKPAAGIAGGERHPRALIPFTTLCWSTRSIPTQRCDDGGPVKSRQRTRFISFRSNAGKDDVVSRNNKSKRSEKDTSKLGNDGGHTRTDRFREPFRDDFVLARNDVGGTQSKSESKSEQLEHGQHFNPHPSAPQLVPALYCRNGTDPWSIMIHAAAQHGRRTWKRLDGNAPSLYTATRHFYVPPAAATIVPFLTTPCWSLTDFIPTNWERERRWTDCGMDRLRPQPKAVVDDDNADHHC